MLIPTACRPAQVRLADTKDINMILHTALGMCFRFKSWLPDKLSRQHRKEGRSNTSTGITAKYILN